MTFARLTPKLKKMQHCHLTPATPATPATQIDNKGGEVAKVAKVARGDCQTRIFANSEMAADPSPPPPVVKCSDCSHFTGKWCSDHKGVWNGRALQSPDAVHSCRGFHAGQHTPEAIPHVTGEQQELFRSLIVQIETGQLPPPLWPKVSRYLKRRLPLYLFNALEELVQDQGGTTPQKEWLSPYPSRCIDCTRREGCQREERGQWGLLNRHSCQEYREVKQ